MVYKIGICDDQAIDREYIQTLVREWAKQELQDIHIEKYSSGEALLFAYETTYFDLLLLDIEMKQIDGVTLAKRIRQQNETVPIVFISGYSDYLAQGYDVAALHYLLKPVKVEKLYEVLNRGILQLREEEKIIVIESGCVTHSIPLKQLRYIEVQGNYATLNGEKSFELRGR
ncbi:LytR/AlgR family response regulator transcription factor [Enterococcus alcedinis]|uniref:LytR/AlgR family response regulator transcription factor n=1 Tax=Enterococcus alcedinis TaxID=1274384 RepID=UPI00361B4580